MKIDNAPKGFEPVEFIDCVRAVLGLEPIPNAESTRSAERKLFIRQPSLITQRAALQTAQAAASLFDGRPRSAGGQDVLS